MLCGLCCVEETTAKLVYCDSILPFQSHSDSAVLSSARTKEVRCNNENIDAYEKHTPKLAQRQPTEFSVTSYLVDGPEFSVTSYLVDGPEFSVTSYLVDGPEFSVTSYLVDGPEFSVTSYLVDGPEFSVTSCLVDCPE